MSIATLSTKFQISIPKEVREKLKLQAGQKIAFNEIDGMICMMRVPTLDELRGSMAGASSDNYRDRSDRLARYDQIKPAKSTRKAA